MPLLTRHQCCALVRRSQHTPCWCRSPSPAMISSEDAKSGLREFVIGIVTLEQVAITSVKVRAAPLFTTGLADVLSHAQMHGADVRCSNTCGDR